MKEFIVRQIKSKKNNNYVHEYFDKRGHLLTKAKVKEVLQGIYIPPAYEDVHINLNKRDKILAIGYDTKDRAQYIYNKQYVKHQSQLKYKQLLEFGESYQQIVSKINKDITLHDDSKDKQIALAMKMIIDCNFRIGNEKYTKENKSFGVTTLEQRHIKQSGNNIAIDFIGKKGVQNKCTIKNKQLTKNLKRAKKNLHKHERIFAYVSGNQIYHLKSSDVNEYLKQFGNFSTKNFRTWNANLELISELVKQIPDTISSREKYVAESIKKVSKQLHHTASVCRKNYIDPQLVQTFIQEPKRFLSFFKNSKTKEDITDNFLDFLESEY